MGVTMTTTAAWRTIKKGGKRNADFLSFSPKSKERADKVPIFQLCHVVIIQANRQDGIYEFKKR